MNLEKLKKLNITLTKSTTFTIGSDMSEGYLEYFLDEYLPEYYNVEDISTLTDEEVYKALEDYNYSDDSELDELLDYMSSIEVKIWK